MTDKGRRASAHERKVIAETHFRKHLHLTSSLHLKHRLQMEAVSGEKVDASSSSHPSSQIKEVLMQTLATLQKSSLFNDPPMSPSCKNSRTDAVCGNNAVSGREEGAEFGSSNVSKDVPFLTHRTKNYPKQRSKQGTGVPPQRERKFRGKRTTRLKLFSTKGARSTGLSAGSCSLQSSKCAPSTKRGAALPSAQERHVDIGGLPQSECTSLWSQSRSHSKGEDALQVSEFRENSWIELGLAEKSIEKTVVNATANVDSLHTSCSNQPLPLRPSASSCKNSGVKPTAHVDSLHTSCSRPLPLGPSVLPNGWVTSERMSSNGGVHSECHVYKNEALDMLCSLSVKYAPKNFHDIIGQHLVTQALSNALSRGRVAPMYIFYGPRGTGKTSCTKLFALALNCLSIGSDRPCGYCRLCLAQICGKFSPVKEVKTGFAYGVKDIASLMKDISRSSSFLYKVCYVDDCQALSKNAWNTLLKGMKAASKRTVFILNTVSLEHIPHAVASQCQKFHFSKIKERDIIDKLQMIAFRENLDADIKAIELIASACNGSLYDAELMLDHISLLGDKVRVPVVQDLVGLISESSLMELLDSALSADITNTVQNLKAFFESGVEPLNLISQLASLITRILAGGYHAPKRKHKSKFFRRKELTNDNMQMLRQALRILSDAEKQVRGSSGGMTWLIAALLQFAPDRSYVASSCPSDTSLTHRAVGRRMDNTSDTPNKSKNLSKIEEKMANHSQFRPRSSMNKATSNARESPKTSTLDASFHHLRVSLSPKACQWPARSHDMPWSGATTAITHLDNHADNIRQQTRTERDDLEQVWQRVLDAISSTNLKRFLQTQGKLVSLFFHKDSKEAVLEFHHREHVSRVQRSKASILHAFQAALGHRIKVKVHLVPRANGHRTKQGHWKQEEARLDLLQQATLVSCSGTSNSNLTNEESAGDTHEEEETREAQWACEPHMVYETGPRYVINSQWNRSNERLQMVSVENIEVGMLPNSRKHMPHDDTYGHVWPKGAMQVEGPYQEERNNWRSLEDTIEGYSLDSQFDHANTTSRQDSTGHHMCADSETRRNLALVAAKLEEENLRMESTSKETMCCKETNNIACKEVACSKHSKYFLSFFPCASVSRQHEAL